MKTTVLISGSRRKFGTALFERLIEIYPDGAIGRSGILFSLRLPEDDPITIAVEKAFNDAGFSRESNETVGHSNKHEYSISLERIYEDVDLQACEYVELLTPGTSDYYVRDDRSGMVVLGIDQLQRGEDFASAGHPRTRVVVPERTKRLLQSGGVTHTLFKPTQLADRHEAGPDSRGPYISWSAVSDEPWWELASDLTLPKVTAKTPLEPAAIGDPARFCERRQGICFNDNLLHYRRREMTAMPPFDLAGTFESMCGFTHSADDRVLVASRRLYELCKELDLKTAWAPVIVDED